jgi:hypothetical protein
MSVLLLLICANTLAYYGVCTLRICYVFIILFSPENVFCPVKRASLLSFSITWASILYKMIPLVGKQLKGNMWKSFKMKNIKKTFFNFQNSFPTTIWYPGGNCSTYFAIVIYSSNIIPLHGSLLNICSKIMTLCNPPDGSTSPKYKLLCFKPP